MESLSIRHRNIGSGVGLDEVLSEYSFRHLSEIGRRAGFKSSDYGSSGELRELVTQHAIARFRENVVRLDSKRYSILKSVAAEDESWRCDDSSYYTLTTSEMAIPYKGSEGFSYVLPDELIDIFKTVESPEAEELADQNDEIYSIICGCILSYGLIDIPKLEMIVGKYLDYELAGDCFIRKLKDCEGLLCTIKVTDNLVYSRCVDDPRYFIREQEKVSEFDYREFSRDEILKASDLAYVPDIPSYNSVRMLLKKHYDCDEECMLLCMSTLHNYAKACREINEPLGYIAHILGDCSEDFIKDFMPIYCEYNNHTFKWALKGHTPEEITRIKNPELLGPMARQRNAWRTRHMADDRPGRNEPCRCGSGKKYKDCCGRN